MKRIIRDFLLICTNWARVVLVKLLIKDHCIIRKRSASTCQLLLLTSAAGISHFCWIRNLGKLVRSQLTTKRNRIHVCDRCLQIFANVEKLCPHERDCSLVKQTQVVLPAKGNNTLRFTSVGKTIVVPFVLYMDFEAVLIPVSACHPSLSVSFSTTYQLHQCFAAGLQVVAVSTIEEIVICRTRGGIVRSGCLSSFVNWLANFALYLPPPFLYV